MRGRPVWLAFFRFASCPLCNYRVHQMVEAWERFDGRDFHLLGIFQSPAERLHDYVAKQQPPFDLVADPAMELYGKYGLETSVLGGLSGRAISTALKARRAGLPLAGKVDGPAMRMPADFLVDGGGTVRVAYQGSSIADHVPLDVVDDFLRERGV